jgi:hypothetical protein
LTEFAIFPPRLIVSKPRRNYRPFMTGL